VETSTRPDLNARRIHTARRWMRRTRDGYVFQYDALTMKEGGFSEIGHAEVLANKPLGVGYRPNTEPIGPPPTETSELNFTRLPDKADPIPPIDSEEDAETMVESGPGQASALEGMSKAEVMRFGEACGIALSAKLSRADMVVKLREAGKG
jgi:hypothetical protein